MTRWLRTACSLFLLCCVLLLGGQQVIPIPAVTWNTPGPSASLYASNPYYSCTSNRYVSTTGNAGNNGTSPSTPWDINTASNYSAPAGTCINMAPGTYNVSGGGLGIIHGGTGASKTGYVVWRCSVMPFSFVDGVLTGEGDGCVFTNTTSYATIGVGPNTPYVMFDGVEVNGTPTAGSGGVCLDNENGGSSSATSHHMWVFNSDLHGCGLSGIQWNYTDWLFVIHNVWHDNGSINCAMGSGLSFYEPAGLANYTPTLGNPDYWYASQTGHTYNDVIAYNVGFRNYNPDTVVPGTCTAPFDTDGEGIIMDTFDWGTACAAGSAICPYTGNVLIMGNVMWGNGGNGIEAFSMLGPPASTSHIDVINNTTYSNSWDPYNTGTFGADLLSHVTQNMTWWNNIGITLSGTRTCLNTNITCSALDVCDVVSTCSTEVLNAWLANMTYLANQYNFQDGETYPLSGGTPNVDGVDPKLVSLNPILSYNGAGVSNFALCTGVNIPVSGCSGKSPAIGIGKPFDLWQQPSPVDVGACPSGLFHCP
jgi:hypothetical protein